MNGSEEPLRAAVIGMPVEHSLSPRIHLAAAKAIGLKLRYDAVSVTPDRLGVAMAQMREQNIRGYSVTMPHKAEVMEHLDELTPAARALGAVNHITNTDGYLVGNNTDGDGFVLGLEHSAGVSVLEKSCAVVGSGGAARAIIDACARHRASRVCVLARSAERARSAAVLAGDRGEVGDVSVLGECDVVVNATPVGMAETDGAGLVPFDVAELRDDAVVVDIVYNPLKTPLLAAAQARGLHIVGGLAMLVGQAAEQFSTWTGHTAPLDAMFAALER